MDNTALFPSDGSPLYDIYSVESIPPRPGWGFLVRNSLSTRSSWPDDIITRLSSDIKKESLFHVKAFDICICLSYLVVKVTQECSPWLIVRCCCRYVFTRGIRHRTWLLAFDPLCSPPFSLTFPIRFSPHIQLDLHLFEHALLDAVCVCCLHSRNARDILVIVKSYVCICIYNATYMEVEEWCSWCFPQSQRLRLKA